MFRHSTTLHHCRSNEFSGFSREHRLVYVGMDWFTQKKIQAAVVWDWLNPVRKAARLFSYSFGGPWILKGIDYGMKGLGKVVDSVEWAGITAKEAAKGLLQMTAQPVAEVAFSRVKTIKRYLWDLPIATVSAAIRTPIAIATSPLEAISGVRDAIKILPKDAKDIFDSITHLRFKDTINGTRKLIGDILTPIKRPAAHILAPAAMMAATAFNAEWQTVSTARDAITQTVPQGAQTLWNAPGTASGQMATILAEREARKAALAAQKEAEKKELADAVAKAQGKEPAGDGKKAG